LAGLATGFYESKEDIKKNVTVDRIFKPNMAEDVRIKLIEGWDEAVKRSFGLAK